MATTGNGKLILYYSPFSYYSQRGYVTLEEKGLKYEKKEIDHHKDNKEPWYLQINPKGEVPAVTFNGQNVPDSNKIIDFLDEQFPESPRLQPDEETPEGKKVRQWRNRMNDIVIDIVTFGCMTHRNELTKNSQFPAVGTKVIQWMLKSSDENYQKYMIKYPDYKEIYEMKMNKFRTFQRMFSDLNIVNKEIENLDVILGEIENQLQETSQKYKDDKYWFLGQTFTAADVFLAVLLNRLKFIGLLHHFQDSKPLLTAYYKRVQQRPSFKKVCIEVPSIMWMIAQAAVAKTMPILLGIGLIGAALAFGYKYVKERNG
ncbi:ganglioside-induced differentiation-associated protein 1-like [Glandiceps talaboti]